MGASRYNNSYNNSYNNRSSFILYNVHLKTITPTTVIMLIFRGFLNDLIKLLIFAILQKNIKKLMISVHIYIYKSYVPYLQINTIIYNSII